MDYELGAAVLVTAKVLLLSSGGGAMTLDLENTPGVVKKADGDGEHYYVKTEHGTHYLHKTKLQHAA